MGTRQNTVPGVNGLYRGADGRYRVDFRYKRPDGGKGRFKKTLPKEIKLEAAKAFTVRTMNDAFAGRLDTRPHEGPRTLSKAFDGFLAWVKGPGASTYVEPARALADARGHSEAWITAVGDLPMSSLGKDIPERFKSYEEKRGVGPATINRRFAMMKRFLRWCASRGWIDKGSAAELREELKPLPEPDGRIRWLTDEERSRLDRTLTPEIKDVAEASAYSGLRLGSVLRIKKEDVDLHHRNLAAWVKRKGTRKRIDLPINETLAGILKRAMARSECEHVFVNHRGAPYTMSGVSSFFRKKVAEAKIKNFRFHDLRHDYGSRLRRNGVPIEDIKDLLGHSDIKMTMRYAHVGKEQLRAAVATLDPGPLVPHHQKRTRKGVPKS